MIAPTSNHRRPPLDPDPLGYRPLSEADLPQLCQWLQAPHVARWWAMNEPATLPRIVAKYRPRIAGQEPTRPWVITYATAPIGYIQDYRLVDYPDYARWVDLAEAAAGVDLLIGELAYAYRGLGAPLLRRFLAEIVFADPAIVSCVIGPAPDNQAAIRAYEKTGFRYLKTIKVPAEPVPEYLMRLTRAGLLASGPPAAAPASPAGQ